MRKLKKLGQPLKELNGLIARTAKDPSADNLAALESSMQAVNNLLNEILDDQTERKVSSPNSATD